MAVIFKTFEEARDYIKKDPIGKSWVRLDDGLGYEVKSNQPSYPTKKTHKKNTISTSLRKRTTILSTPLVLNTKKTVQPLQTRVQSSKGKISSSRSPDGRRATHSPKPANKYPKQYIDEPLGTREDSKKMYGRQGAINKTNKN